MTSKTVYVRQSPLWTDYQYLPLRSIMLRGFSGPSDMSLPLYRQQDQALVGALMHQCQDHISSHETRRSSRVAQCFK